MQKGKLRENKGITLIALIITIIVMLILVGVTVSVALNGGLFSTAKQAAQGTQYSADYETLQAGVIAALNKDTLKIESAQNLQNNLPAGWSVTGGGPYEATSPNGNQFTVTEDGEIIDKKGNGEKEVLPDGWTKTDKPAEWTSDKVIAVTDGENIIPLPEGFEMSDVDGEHTVEGGLVIREGANEFVWVPVSNAETYTEDSFGPLTGTDTTSKCVYDSQEQLDYYYGEGYFNYSQDFNYAEDKTNIERSIRTYGGFYVGRYETTIDENGSIGSMKNKEVLTADKKIAKTNNKEVRWYGLYKVEKDMYADSPSVGSLMISSKQWDAIMTETGYGSATRATNTYTTTPDLSGSAYKDTNPVEYDVAKNIYDLAGNVCERTLKADGKSDRVSRGRSLHRQPRFGILQ